MRPFGNVEPSIGWIGYRLSRIGSSAKFELAGKTDRTLRKDPTEL